MWAPAALPCIHLFKCTIFLKFFLIIKRQDKKRGEKAWLREVALPLGFGRPDRTHRAEDLEGLTHEEKKSGGRGNIEVWWWQCGRIVAAGSIADGEAVFTLLFSGFCASTSWRPL